MVRKYSMIIFKMNDSYIARCMELGIASQGETEEEAREGLREIFEIIFAGGTGESVRPIIPNYVYLPRLH